MTAPTLHVQGLTGGVLRGVDIEVRACEVVGLVGTKGSGIDELLDVLCGFDPLLHGSIELLGEDVTRTEPHRRAALGLRRTFGAGGLIEDTTSLANLLSAQHLLAGYGAVRGLVTSVFGEELDLTDRAEEMLRRFGVSDGRVRDLDARTRRHLVWAMATIASPQLLVMDEPTVGASLDDEDEIAHEIRALDVPAILLADRHVPFVLSVADHVYCLDAGRVVAAGPPDEVRGDPAVAEALLGVSGRRLRRRRSSSARPA